MKIITIFSPLQLLDTKIDASLRDMESEGIKSIKMFFVKRRRHSRIPDIHKIRLV